MGVEKQEVIRDGTGAKPAPGQIVTIHWTGYGKNGDLSRIFWSTREEGQIPDTFQIGKGDVIKGWDEGVMDMQVGEIASFRCTPDYAYGACAFPGLGVKANSVIVFHIELVSVQ